MKTLSSNAYSNSKKVSVYEWMRIIGTIFVVIGHSAYINISSEFGGINYVLPEQLNQQTFYHAINNFISYSSSFHMPLFFFLSGAVLHLKPLKSFKEFVSGKAKRLLIPYVFVGLLFMLPIKYLTGFYEGKEIIYAIFHFFVSTYESGHLWFLPALFLCMVIFVIMIKVSTKFNCYNEHLLLLISLILQYASRSFISTEILGIKKALSYISWFALGYWFETIRKKPLLKQDVISIICYIALICIDTKSKFLPYEIETLLNCIGIYFVSELLSRSFSTIGESKMYIVFVRNLFNIYLFHDPLEYIILKLFMGNNWLTNTLGCYIYMFCRFVVVIIISILIGELIRLISIKIKELKCRDLKCEN